VGYGFLIAILPWSGLAIASYLIWSAIGRQSLRIKQWTLPNLPLPLALAQVVAAALDWISAAAVLYVLLPSTATLSFWGFLGIFLLAQLAGIISNVPGGLGVFETVLILMLSPPLASDKLIGALLAYRAIYYLIPLFLGVVLFAVYEFKRRNRGKQTLAKNR
jgi:hypothetical protein